MSLWRGAGDIGFLSLPYSGPALFHGLLWDSKAAERCLSSCPEGAVSSTLTGVPGTDKTRRLVLKSKDLGTWGARAQGFGVRTDNWRLETPIDFGLENTSPGLTGERD